MARPTKKFRTAASALSKVVEQLNGKAAENTGYRIVSPTFKLVIDSWKAMYGLYIMQLAAEDRQHEKMYGRLKHETYPTPEQFKEMLQEMNQKNKRGKTNPSYKSKSVVDTSLLYRLAKHFVASPALWKLADQLGPDPDEEDVERTPKKQVKKSRS